MKAKKLLAMLLLVLMMFATVGTMAGCGGNDSGDDKKVEKQDKDDDKKDTEKEPEATEAPEATKAPEATETPAPTEAPEVLPTAEEIFDANKDMFDGKMKMSAEFAYTGESEYGEMEISLDMEMFYYDDVTYECGEVTVSILDITETIYTETYCVNDADSGLTTEYSYDSENEMWVKSEYAYVAVEEEKEDFPFDSMKDVEITAADGYYYLTGVLDDAELWGDTDSLGVDGLEIGTMTCTLKCEKDTKKAVKAEIVYKFDLEAVEGATVSADDMKLVVERLTSPIEIPEEVLAAELAEDLW